MSRSCLRQLAAFDELKLSERQLAAKAAMDLMQVTTDVTISSVLPSNSRFAVSPHAQVFYRCSPVISPITRRIPHARLLFVPDNPIVCSKTLAMRLVADKTMPCTISLLDLYSIKDMICIGGDNFWGIFKSADGNDVRTWASTVACAQNYVRSIMVSPDGAVLFGSQDGFVRCARVDGPIIEEFPAHDAPVSYIMLAEFGNRSVICTASDTGEVKAWDIVGSNGATDLVLIATVQLGNETVRRQEMGSEPMLVVIITNSGKVAVWNIETGSLEWETKQVVPMRTTKLVRLEVKEREVVVRSRLSEEDYMTIDLAGMKIELAECWGSFIAVSSENRVRIWKVSRVEKKDRKLRIYV